MIQTGLIEIVKKYEKKYQKEITRIISRLGFKSIDELLRFIYAKERKIEEILKKGKRNG